jgi:hypothetical protein
MGVAETDRGLGFSAEATRFSQISRSALSFAFSISSFLIREESSVSLDLFALPRKYPTTPIVIQTMAKTTQKKMSIISVFIGYHLEDTFSCIQKSQSIKIRAWEIWEFKL